MKKVYLFSFLFIVTASLYAQTPTYGWARSISGSGNDFVNSMIVGNDNNPVIVGSFASLSLSIADTTLTNPGNYYNSFIMKYDDNGNRLWVNQVYGVASDTIGSEEGLGLSNDNNGNLYFTGSYVDTIFFGSHVSLPDDVNSTENAFTVKYNSDGNVQWAKRVRNGVGNGTATGPTGNIAIGGLFFYADTLMLIDTILTTDVASGNASFIIQYDEAGNRLWEQVLNGAALNALSTDRLGNLYITGNIVDDTAFIGSYTLLNSDPMTSTNDIFVAKYTSTGTLLWAESFGGVQDDEALAMCVSPNNEVNVLGSYDSPELDFGSTALTNPVGADFTFVARFDSSGSPIWAQSSQLDNPTAIATDAANSVFISGDYYDTIVIIGADTLHNSSYENMFVVKYSAAGNVDWALNAPGSNDSLSGVLIANDANGNSYVALNYDNSPLQLGNTLLSPAGGLDIAVAKLDNTSVGTAIKNQSIADIRVFPNPSTGLLYFTGLAPGAQIDIYDLVGDRIYSAISQNGTQQLNLNVAKGMYIYQVTGSSTQSGKIVIE